MKKNPYKYLMHFMAVAFMLSVSPGFSPSAFAAGGYSFSQIDFVPKTGTQANGITEDGQVIGGTFDPLSEWNQGFYDLVGYGFFLLNYPNHWTNINGICGNVDGFQVVGSIPGICAFVGSTSGVFTEICHPGAGVTYGTGCNIGGQVVGYYYPGNGFLWDSSGNFTNIDYPNAIYTRPYDINNSGVIVGEYWPVTPGPSRGFLRDSNGNFSTIDYPGAYSTTPMGINDTGQIVGTYNDASGGTHGFLRETTGKFTKIDVTGATRTIASGISNTGRIVGTYYSKSDDRAHGFLYSPK